MASRGSTSGFSLIEVAIATTILALAISSSLSVMSQGFRAMDTSRSVRVATQILQDEMENVRMAAWTTVEGWAVGGSGTQLALDASYSNNPYIRGRFVCRRIVENVAGKPTMRAITLTVRWKGNDGLEHVRSVKTFYTQSGLYSYVAN